ncbi:hypothetical protein BJ875DRAFT_255774 [Amylocarpus encephaloides]|uniref:CCHC-type domain-containing protein n=1 Tax=Amylocarpus encephaloides TaxID=45428 RepID=A0A9P7YMJ3_9HELO|nr:hypothetical protein BJ875DRAFT_255774 [Amylocarpus encephaloides]
MSGSWNQGYQSAYAPVNYSGRSPICFNCGLEGHYLISCPRPRRTSGIVTAPPPNAYQQHPPPAPLPQEFPQQTAPVQMPNQQYPQGQQYGTPSMQPQYGYDQQPLQQAYNQGPPIPTYVNVPYQGSHNNQYPYNSGYSQYDPQSSSPQQYGAPQYGAAQQPAQYDAQQYGPPYSVLSYQAPTPMYQPAQSTSGYNLNYAPPPNNFQGPPQQQWNNMPPPPVTRSAPPYRCQQGSYFDSSSPSGTHGFQGQQPQQAYPCNEFHAQSRSRSNQSTPQPSIASNIPSQQPTPNRVHAVPATSRPKATTSHGASTPFPQSETTTTGAQKEAISKSAANRNRRAPPLLKDSDDQENLTEDQQFEWDMAWIFMSVPPKETVQLSQPLQLDFATPPVPVQGKPFTRSTSRYARKDNELEFVKHVQKSPHWALFKDDPAFTPIDIYAELISVDRIIHWTMERHGLIEPTDTPSLTRKRTRLENIQEVVDDEHQDKTTRVKVETATEPKSDVPPSKRQKSEQEKENSIEKPGTPVITTPVYTARDGTPCLPTDDEAWMPQPGEGAASAPSPDDPMEDLLASLGVTGAPKPVVEEPLPPYNPPQEDTVLDIVQAPSELPENKPPVHVPPVNTQQKILSNIANTYTNGQIHQGSHVATPHPSMPNSQNKPPQFCPPANRPYQNGQQLQSQQAPIHPTYHNGVPQNATYGNPQYGVPNQQPYGNGINSQQGPNPSYAPPVDGVYYNGAPAPRSYSIPQNQHPPYGPGPQQNNNYDAPHPYNQPVNYNNDLSNNYVNGANGEAPYQQTPNQPQYRLTSPQKALFCQDSEYGSAGASLSNSASQQNFPQQASDSQQMPPPTGKQPRHDTLNGTSNSATIPAPYGNHDPTNNKCDSKKTVRSNSMDDGQDGSPLSPMSQEILGKLSQPTRKSSSGSRKRPAPVIDEAYRYKTLYALRLKNCSASFEGPLLTSSIAGVGDVSVILP